jgi:hypothetical protein
VPLEIGHASVHAVVAFLTFDRELSPKFIHDDCSRVAGMRTGVGSTRGVHRMDQCGLMNTGIRVRDQGSEKNRRECT